LRSSVLSAHPSDRSTCIRAAVALLYAHWEGFIKAASEAYLSFVALQGLRYNELSPGLLAVCFRGHLVSLREVSGLAAHKDFAEFVLTGLSSRARLRTEGAVQTKSNLDSRRLKYIICMLGLDFSPYELKQNLIDTQLLKWRNTIAHGQYLCPSQEDFESLYQDVAALIRDFKDQLANAAAQGNYRRT
jgi:hypothetical protein